jgi:hypothetical protein
MDILKIRTLFSFLKLKKYTLFDWKMNKNSKIIHLKKKSLFKIDLKIFFTI